MQTVTIPAEPPKRFALSEVLKSGAVPDAPPGQEHFRIWRYRLTDVQVGDWVCIMYSRVGGVDICTFINIAKRPGGRVPPLPDGVETPPRRPEGFPPQPPRIRYHEYRNAHWDLEDKGIPYPEKFGPNRRFPIAPPPRMLPPPGPPRDP